MQINLRQLKDRQLVRSNKSSNHSVNGVRFVAWAFAPGHWLDLKNAASTVQGVTFVAAGAPPDGMGDDLVAEFADRRLLIAEVRRFVRDEVDVGFVEEEPLEGWRTVWGW
jgi:hypothetical protein